MKHLLIILSILLLSSPVIGQETGVLYQYETSSGLVWKTFGDGKVQPKYKGEIKNGKMDGLGVLIYPYYEKSVVGEWKNGKEWNTKHTKKDGTILGKFENGEWIGSWGVFYLGKRNGERGYFTEKWAGLDSKENKDLAKYEGEIKNGYPNGQGMINFPDGRKYVGGFKDGDFDGQGTFTFSDGTKYIGELKDGNYDGQGIRTYPDGTKYLGEWKGGEKDGKGTMTLPDGSKYVGEFKDGDLNGQGTFNFSDGRKYVGEWKDSESDGQGTYTLPNGREYVGEFKDGHFLQGTMTLPDGQKFEGEFKDGEPLYGTMYDKDGKFKWKNSQM